MHRTLNIATAALLCPAAVAAQIDDIRVQPPTVSIVVNQRITMRATPIRGDSALRPSTDSWTSANPEIAMVNPDGVLFGISEGKTTLMYIAQVGGDVDTAVVQVGVSGESAFQLRTSIGAAFGINSDQGSKTTQHAGLQGFVTLTELDGWGDTNGLGFFRGPVHVEGDLILAVAPTREDTATAAGNGTPAASDSVSQFRNSSQGLLRLSVPFLEFRDDVRLNLFFEEGFVARTGLTNYWYQRFVGTRLTMDALGTSYVEFAFGKSENLRPQTTRTRITVQLQVPGSNVTFRLWSNRAPGKRRQDPKMSDSPVIIALFTDVPVGDVLRLLGVGGG